MANAMKRADLEKQEYELVDIDTLIEHPQNPNVGDEDEVMLSIKNNGWFGTIEVQRSTRYVCAGNTRLRAAKRLGLKRLPVVWINVNNERALAILLADNRVAQKAHMNDVLLRVALEELNAAGEIMSTGYDSGFLADLQRELDKHLNSGLADQGDASPPSDPPVPPNAFEKSIRSLVLDFTVDAFTALVPRLETVRSYYEVETNEAALLLLIDGFEEWLSERERTLR